MNEGTASSGNGRGESEDGSLPAARLSSITPYIIVAAAAQFIEFLKSHSRHGANEDAAPDGSIMHAEVAIGNRAIEVSDGNAEYPTAPAAIHSVCGRRGARTNAHCAREGDIDDPVGIIRRAIFQGAVKDQFGNHCTSPSQAANGLRGGRGAFGAAVSAPCARRTMMIPFMEAWFGAGIAGYTNRGGRRAARHDRIGERDAGRLTNARDFQRCLAICTCTCRTRMRCLRAGAAAGATSIETPQDRAMGTGRGSEDAFGNSCLLRRNLRR